MLDDQSTSAQLTACIQVPFILSPVLSYDLNEAWINLGLCVGQVPLSAQLLELTSTPGVYYSFMVLNQFTYDDDNNVCIHEIIRIGHWWGGKGKNSSQFVYILLTMIKADNYVQGSSRQQYWNGGYVSKFPP